MLNELEYEIMTMACATKQITSMEKLHDFIRRGKGVDANPHSLFFSNWEENDKMATQLLL